MVEAPEQSQTARSNETLPYRNLVGSLMFLASQTRPDIAYAVGMLGRHAHNYQAEHFQAAKRVLRYLLTTKNKKLLAGGGSLLCR